MNYLWFLLLASFWGGSFVAIKLAVNHFPPFFDAFLRVALSLIIVGIIFRIQNKNLTVAFTTRCRMWLVGLFAQGIPFSFLFWGERFISPGLAGILNGLVPIFAFILSPLVLFRSDYSSKNIIGLLFGITGIIIIFYPLIVFSGNRQELIGSTALLGMSFSYAVGSLLNQRFFALKKELLSANIYHQHFLSMIYLLIISLLFEQWPTWNNFVTSPNLWLSIGYLSLFSTALAWLIYFWLIQEWGALRATTATYVAPIMAIFWDYIFFYHVPRSTEIVGVITILLGVVLIQLPNLRLPFISQTNKRYPLPD